MEDAELTRLAIAEIVREMGELKEPQVQERKINPIAKPNKRFLGRTLNSMLSHNKRENDRTQENCRRKLKELDERRNESKPMRSSNRSANRELVLSSSTEEDRTKYLKKRRKRDKKSKPKKYKKRKKRDKSKRRKSSRYDSSDSCSSSSRSTSRSRSRSGSGRSRKTHKDLKSHLKVNEEEGEQTHCEPDMDAALQLEAALMSNSYRQHQIHQLLYYSALIAGNETPEIDTLQEELQISDADILEPQVDIKSISSADSSSNLEEGDSEASEILQISLSSATSTSSKAQSSKNLRRKNVKERKSKKKSELSDSSSGVIWELDSESSKNCTYSKEGNLNEKQESINECICIGSETNTDTDNETDSDNTTSDTESGSENATNVPNNVWPTAAETVTLLSSSDSEVEIVTDSNANSLAQGVTGIDSAAIAAYSTANSLNSLENVTETDGLPSLVKDTTVLDASTKLILTSLQQTTTNHIGDPSMEGVAEELSHVTNPETSFTISTVCILPDAPASATDVNVFIAESKSTIEDVTILSADINKFRTKSQPTSEGICLEQAQKEEASVEESESLEDLEFQPPTERICLEQAQKGKAIVEESESLEDPEFQPPTERICLEHAQEVNTTILEELESLEDSESQTTTEKICLEEAQEVNTPIVEKSDSPEVITPSTVNNESSNRNIIDIEKFALTTTYSEEAKPTKGSTPDADLSVSESDCGEAVMESMDVAVAKTPPNLSISHNSDSSCNSSPKTSVSPLPTDLESDAIQNENKSGIVPSELYDRQVSSLDNLPNSAPS